MLGQSTSLNIFKTIEIIQNIFSNNKEIKLEINPEKKTGNFTKMWKLNGNTLKTANGSKKKSQGKSENIYKWVNVETQHTKIYRWREGSAQSEIHRYKMPVLKKKKKFKLVI